MRESAHKFFFKKNDANDFQETIDASNEFIVLVDSQLKVVTCNTVCKTVLANYFDMTYIEKVSLAAILQEIPTEDEDKYSSYGQFENNVTASHDLLTEPQREDIGILLAIPVCNLNDPSDFFEIKTILKKCLTNAFTEAMVVKLNSKKIREHEEKINQQNQLNFVAVICHEIRNPLNGIYGVIDILQKSISNIEKQLNSLKADNNLLLKEMYTMNEVVQSLEECAEQQKKIVDDVLDFSKLSANKVQLNPTVFDPKKVVENIKTMFQAKLDLKKLKLNLQMPTEKIWVKGDELRIKQIIINLLSNAIKFTDQGEITVKLKVTPKTEFDMELTFIIIDTGIGITSDEIKNIFNHFSQANPQTAATHGGTGLGLPICKSLIERMGGNINVSSQKGKGTTFDFTVSCNKPTEEEILNLNQQSHKRPLDTIVLSENYQQQQILIVEDDPINQKILEKYLEHPRYSCRLAKDGLEAVKLYEQDNNFDIILMDTEMPVMNGLEAVRQIRAIEDRFGKKRVPIVSLSGNSGLEQIQEVLNAGMDDYLIKPYKREDVYRKLNQYVAQPLDELSNQQKLNKVPKVESHKGLTFFESRQQPKVISKQPILCSKQSEKEDNISIFGSEINTNILQSNRSVMN